MNDTGRTTPHPGKDPGAKINRRMGRAIAEFGLIAEGDRIVVAVSGGKDSLTLLHFLLKFKRKAPVSFDLLAVHVDQSGGEEDRSALVDLFREWEVPHLVESQNVAAIVSEKLKPGQNPCFLCSRMRRGILYRIAAERGCNRIALGHHRDDFLETFLLNGFFAGKLGTMTPVYRSRVNDLMVIRPLYSVPEEWIESYVESMGWTAVTCSTCGDQESFRRKQMKELLARLESEHPGMKDSLFRALGNPHTDELLYRPLWSHPDYAVPDAQHGADHTMP